MEYIAIGLLIIVIIQVQRVLSVTKQRTPNGSKQPVYIDTSALMDGRIITAAKTGFIPHSLVVPKSVVAELQLLADQADPEKRARARRGLDAVNELQEMKHVSVAILDDGPIASGGVDERLVELARTNNGMVCTIDFNLNKVATVHGIFVLNVNELAKNIRMAFLPGERINLQLTQKGQDQHQGVGYLADGTMVVVEQGANHINSMVEVEFIRSLQTAAGRMMFARLADEASLKATSQKKQNGRKNTRTTARKTNSKRQTQSSKEDSLIALVNENSSRL